MHYAFRGQWIAGLETTAMPRQFQSEQLQERGGELGGDVREDRG